VRLCKKGTIEIRAIITRRSQYSILTRASKIGIIKVGVVIKDIAVYTEEVNSIEVQKVEVKR